MVEVLTTFAAGNRTFPVEFQVTDPVTDGVDADLYVVTGKAHEMDLALVSVQPGCKTPRQLVQGGDKTVEGYYGGNGELHVTKADGTHQSYAFEVGGKAVGHEVEVGVGDVMQWTCPADAEQPLQFYELCWPPYEEGRFENLPDQSA